MITVRVNSAAHQLDAVPETPLLWVLRENLGFTGVKYGCGTYPRVRCAIRALAGPA
jgi:isoquinoline 1-oxidoreductase subunit alpha